MAEIPESWKSFKSDTAETLIDGERLAAWLDVEGLAPSRPLEVRRLSGGMSNESFTLTRGTERWVLRRPAKVALEGADRGMRREFRVLSALVGTPVPIPRPLALCTDSDVIGSAFYVMQYVEGWTALDPTPERFQTDAALQREASLSYMDALGSLAGVDWQARGLEGYGNPEGFHERQVSRWLRQLESTQGRELPRIHEVGAWLSRNQPAAWQPGIMHGDYHTGNVMLAPDSPGRVTGVLDWENSTIGDPLLDLGGFLRIWCSGERATWCEREALIGRWEERSGRQTPDLRYYTVLSAFKLAVMLEGIYQRSLADSSRGSGEMMGEMVMQLAGEAIAALEA